VIGLGAIALLLASLLPAQTIEQAEAFRKARRFQEANGVFRALVAQNPNNPDYRVRWGRLYLDHSQPKEAVDLFNEALVLKKDHAGALLGLALVAAENFEGGAAGLAHKALASDPKLLEAQELLARLALEDNDTAKAVEEANKALAIDANSVGGRAILAAIDWLAGKQDTAFDPHAAAATKPPPTFSFSTAATKKASSITGRPSISIRNCTVRARNWASTSCDWARMKRPLNNSRPAITTISRTKPPSTR